jgi:hypothetical protein
MEAAVTALFDKATNTVSYIVADPATAKAAIVDCVLDFNPKSARTSTCSARPGHFVFPRARGSSSRSSLKIGLLEAKYALDGLDKPVTNIHLLARPGLEQRSLHGRSN